MTRKFITQETNKPTTGMTIGPTTNTKNASNTTTKAAFAKTINISTPLRFYKSCQYFIGIVT